MTHCARLSPPRNSRRWASRRSLPDGAISYQSLRGPRPGMSPRGKGRAPSATSTLLRAKAGVQRHADLAVARDDLRERGSVS